MTPHMQIGEWRMAESRSFAWNLRSLDNLDY
jgi:hypothetical protein